MQNPKLTAEKLGKLAQAWQDLAPDKTFGGMNLADFRTKVQPSSAAVLRRAKICIPDAS